jgi:hypothetical protein
MPKRPSIVVYKIDKGFFSSKRPTWIDVITYPILKCVSNYNLLQSVN